MNYANMDRWKNVSETRRMRRQELMFISDPNHWYYEQLRVDGRLLLYCAYFGCM